MSRAGQGPAAARTRDEALDWLLRGPDARADADFRAWLAADPAHAAAFAEAERLWKDPAFVAALLGQKRAKPKWRRTALRTATAAAVLVAVGLGALRLGGLPLRFTSDYATRIGAETTERLADGSVLTLDTASAADVDFSAAERRLTLRAGRIFIVVHHDARPFRVRAGAVTIEDIGTEFSVERSDGDVTVAVRQGEVALTAGGSVERISANESGGVRDGVLEPVRTIDPSVAFAWLNHWLFFQDAPLAAVVAELRRYDRGWIVIARPRLGDVKVSGGYDLRRPAAAIRDLARLSGADLTAVSDRLLILH